MSAEPSQITSSQPWTQWENQVVNGVFPLRRLLGSSNRSAVFLTEYKARNVADAAIKLVRTDASQAQALLGQWQAAATLSHPHLIRLFAAGRCQFGSQEFVFVVMEQAEQTLAQILHQRALHPAEVNELLLPALDALAFLHRNQRVHGQLKPANIFAVGDQLKLASDTIRSAGTPAPGIAATSAYDPPELKDGGCSPAGDIWALGMTLVEAFTRRTAWPASFPAPYVDTARRCLSSNPADRPTVIELEAQYKPSPRAPSPSVPPPSPQAPAPQPAISQPPVRQPSTPQPTTSQPPVRQPSTPQPSISQPSAPPPAARRAPVIAAAYKLSRRNLLVIAAALLASLVWIVAHFSDTSQPPAQPSVVAASPPVVSSTSTVASPPASTSTSATSAESDSPPTSPAARAPTVSSSVIHQVTPDVPESVREKIKGRLYVTVRVLVEPSGNVVGALMENPGSSRYFARLAEDAARQWQFVPAENRAARVWLLRFEFTRDGVAARAIEQ